MIIYHSKIATTARDIGGGGIGGATRYDVGDSDAIVTATSSPHSDDRDVASLDDVNNMSGMTDLTNVASLQANISNLSNDVNEEVGKGSIEMIMILIMRMKMKVNENEIW